MFLVTTCSLANLDEAFYLGVFVAESVRQMVHNCLLEAVQRVIRNWSHRGQSLLREFPERDFGWVLDSRGSGLQGQNPGKVWNKIGTSVPEILTPQTTARRRGRARAWSGTR